MLTAFLRVLTRSFRLAAPYGRRKAAVVIALTLANGIMQVIGVSSVFPFFTLAADPQRFLNSGVGRMLSERFPHLDAHGFLIAAGLLSILLLAVSNALAMLTEVVRARYSYGLAHFLRMQVMGALAAREYGYFIQHNSAAFLQKVLGDVFHFITGVFQPLLEVISRSFTLLLLMAGVFIFQPLVALSAGTAFGILYVGAFLTLRRRSHEIGQGLKVANRGTHVTAQQFLGGIKAILVHDKAGHFLGQFEQHSKTQAKLTPKIPIYANGPRYLIEPLAIGSIVIIVLALSARGQSFTSALPSLSVLAFAAYRMLPSFQGLFAGFTQINSMHYVLGEIEAELREFAPAAAPSQPAPDDALAPLAFRHSVRLDKISFAYPGTRRPVLEDFSLEIHKKQSIGIVGTTGSGKSTLVDLLLCLHRPASGRILVDDEVLEGGNVQRWRRLIGYVPQDIYLMDASIAENIAFGVVPSRIDREALRRAAAAAQILDFIEQELPEGWRTVVGERGVRLSGGQRQRIGLARALYHDPAVLILDEATSALDQSTEAEVMSAIKNLKGTVTMILIAHRLTTLKGCDMIVDLGTRSRAEASSLSA